MKGSKVGKVVGWVFIGIGIAAALGLVLGFGLQWLWNLLMPDIFGLKPITYWQAVGLFVLSHLLFKGHHHHGPGEMKEPSWKKKWCAETGGERQSHPPAASAPDPVTEKIRHLLDDGPSK